MKARKGFSGVFRAGQLCGAIGLLLCTVPSAPAIAQGTPPSTAPATREASQRQTYSFRGYTVQYPATWRLRQNPGGRPASIYKPAGDGFSAIWDFDRREDAQRRTAEQVRDDVAKTLPVTMRGFQLKDTGSFKLSDGAHAAYLTFAHTAVGPEAIERQVFIPQPDGAVIIAVELAPAASWEAESAALHGITMSVRADGK